MEKKKVLLSLKNLEVKFHVRGRELTAIRGISLDIKEDESIAIVGESGSGKSVLTKTFAGMLDGNGFISHGEINLSDDVLSDTIVKYTDYARKAIIKINKYLNEASKLEFGSETYQQIQVLKGERMNRINLSPEENREIEDKLQELKYNCADLYNYRQTLDSKMEKEKIIETNRQLKDMEYQLSLYRQKKSMVIKQHKEALEKDVEFTTYYSNKMNSLLQQYNKEIQSEITDYQRNRNEKISKEIYLSVGRYGTILRQRLSKRLCRAIKKAMRFGIDLYDERKINKVFDTVAFRVAYLDEGPLETIKGSAALAQKEKTAGMNPEFVAKNHDIYLHGYCNLDLAKIKYTKDWQQIRGTRVATIFQDPMTSLNPIITIGKQITSVILKHQNCNEAEARERAIILMKKVGIPSAEDRFDDYPFQYSGGMRQRIVIAIALSCQPKILICDEPTTALDVTIQAQILKLIKDLQKEFHYTIVFITHDLGVVAKIADRVAVLYAGQIVELGTCEDIFYEPKHPYTWALLSSLPQLSERGKELYSISGTPPSLYNKVIGDPFAPRNPYCLKIDTIKDSPMFKVSETHYAKTWLLDPRSPKIEKPEIIDNIHEKLLKVFNI